MKRREKTEVEPEAETEQTEQIERHQHEQTGAPSTVILEEKTAEPEEMAPPTAAPNAITATSQAPTAKTKPSLGPRGLTFRTPPVFRASTNPPAGQLPADAQPPGLRRFRSDPDRRIPGSGPSRGNTGASKTSRHTIPKPAEAKADDEPPMSQIASIVLLIVSTVLVALCAEFLVGSINHLVKSSPLSEAFVGLIILPIVGNAAEHVTAVTVAAKNKLDLALGVSLGSSIQIALFVTPIVVLLGWILNKDMSLYFSLFEVAALFVSTFIVNFLVLDGRSNYLEGALLCACYIIIAVGAYFFPDSQQQSLSTSGPSSS